MAKEAKFLHPEKDLTSACSLLAGLLPRPPLRPSLPGSSGDLGLGCRGHPASAADGPTHRHRLRNAEEPGELGFECFDAAFDLGGSIELLD